MTTHENGVNKKGRLRAKQEMRLIPRASREVWYPDKPAEITVPKGYRRKWTDDETERVIKVTPASFNSYQDFADSLNPPRTAGAVRWRKAIVVALLNGESYARERAESGNHKYHDWAQVHRVLKERGYYELSISQQMEYARHLPMPSSSWRGDGTQSVLKERNLRKLDTPAALRELIKKKLADIESE